jgi:protein disulfide-isomerase
MKKIFLLSFAFFCRVAITSQELNWHTDVKEAISLGSKENKPLLLFSQVVIGVDGVSVCKRSVVYSRICKWATKMLFLLIRLPKKNT